MARTLSANSRLYIELGSVWVKTLASQKIPFTVLTYNPVEKRVQARICKLVSVGNRPTRRFTTTRGLYEVGADAWIRLLTGEPKPVSELQPGMLLQAAMLHNQEGLISVETIYRDMWLHELVEADQQGYKMHLSVRNDMPPERSERVLKVEEGPEAPCYEIDLGMPPPSEPNATTLHNLLLWSDGTSFGSGVYGAF